MATLTLVWTRPIPLKRKPLPAKASQPCPDCYKFPRSECVAHPHAVFCCLAHRKDNVWWDEV
ncbi:hypothetical protein HRbin30_02736 [bacterium HR30]|nr:hypothetical protein HRbin30_02736 [bacterium HR30]